MYSGNDLFRQAGDGVVAVIIQYRLGLFALFLPLVCASALVLKGRKTVAYSLL